MFRLLPQLHVQNWVFRLHQNISFSDLDYNLYSIRHVASLWLFAQPKLHFDEPVKKFVIKENQKENIVLQIIPGLQFFVLFRPFDHFLFGN